MSRCYLGFILISWLCITRLYSKIDSMFALVAAGTEEQTSPSGAKANNIVAAPSPQPASPAARLPFGIQQNRWTGSSPSVQSQQPPPPNRIVPTAPPMPQVPAAASTYQPNRPAVQPTAASPYTAAPNSPTSPRSSGSASQAFMAAGPTEGKQPTDRSYMQARAPPAAPASAASVQPTAANAPVSNGWTQPRMSPSSQPDASSAASAGAEDPFIQRASSQPSWSAMSKIAGGSAAAAHGMHGKQPAAAPKPQVRMNAWVTIIYVTASDHNGGA